MKIGRICLHFVFGMLVLVGFAGATVSAADTAKASTATTTTQSSATSGGSLQGYASDTVLQNGTVVQLTPKSATKVTPATAKDMQQMFGVTVDPHELSVTLTDSSLTNEVYVATSGTYKVLVSNQGGTIQPGDYVTMSAIDGIAMKADTAQPTVLGRAAAGFDGKSNTLGTASLKDTTGKPDKTVSFGLIPVTINIQRNPNEKSTKANLPKALQRLGEAIAEKPIGPLRIYLSIAITGLSLIVAIITLYSGVRSSMIAIGRNPLSKKSVFRALLEIILTAFLILIIGLFAVYLLLKL